jgi:hypothetical protein
MPISLTLPELRALMPDNCACKVCKNSSLAAVDGHYSDDSGYKVQSKCTASKGITFNGFVSVDETAIVHTDSYPILCENQKL